MRILRNTENDRCFPFHPALAREKWVEMLDIVGTKVPEHMSESERRAEAPKRISKETLPKDSYEIMHWTRLKKEVERLGGKYSTPAEAADYLREMDKKAMA